MAGLDSRVEQVADDALAGQQFVTPVDVMLGLGWVAKAKVDLWLAGFVTSLDRCLRVTPTATHDAIDTLSAWARESGLQPWETDYAGLAFSDDPAYERAFRIRWAPSDTPSPKNPSPRPTVRLEYLKVDCDNCGGIHKPIVSTNGGGFCLDCAGLGHLVYLPAGDAALTRRTTKTARLTIAVGRVHTRRSREGVLAEQRDIEHAAQQCLADDHRNAHTDDLGRTIADGIRAEFPGCPPARAGGIARFLAVYGGYSPNACKHPDTICEWAAASVRHIDTGYDNLILSGVGPVDACRRVQPRVDDILGTWRSGITGLDAPDPVR